MSMSSLWTLQPRLPQSGLAPRVSRVSIFTMGIVARSYVLFILPLFLPARGICYRLLRCAFAIVLLVSWFFGDS